MADESMITIWRQILKTKPWVLFKNGTVVVVEVDTLKDGETAESHAKELMKSMGPVMAGCSHGDFNIINPTGITEGWVVAGHCPTMYTFVWKEEMEGQPNEMVIGIYGRGKRHQDSETCEIVHVEN